MTDFGRTMHTQGAVLLGKLSENGWRDFLVRCAENMGMNPVGDPAVYHYPVLDGKGGTGMTIMQPITESALIADVWEFEGEPQHGAYLQIMSCKPFGLRQLIAAIDEFGLEIKSAASRQVLEL